MWDEGKHSDSQRTKPCPTICAVNKHLSLTCKHRWSKATVSERHQHRNVASFRREPWSLIDLNRLSRILDSLAWKIPD